MKSLIIQLIGFSTVLLGWIIAALEIYHISAGKHRFEVTPWSFVLVFITVGALAIQTGEMTKSVEFIKSIRKPGGKRFYDGPVKPYWKRNKKIDDGN